jgi:hypothetical protein
MKTFFFGGIWSQENFFGSALRSHKAPEEFFFAYMSEKFLGNFYNFLFVWNLIRVLNFALRHHSF